MVAAVELLPGGGVGEPEVGAAVDDDGRRSPPPAARRSRRTGRAGARGRPRRGRERVSRLVSSSTRSASGTRCGCRPPSGWPALDAPVRAPISTSGCPSSRRSSSPPAYPLAPATATRLPGHVHDYTHDCMSICIRVRMCRSVAAIYGSHLMARLSFDDYLRHLRADSARFREVLAGCDPEARVPGCPDWTAADLLWHHARRAVVLGARSCEQRPAPDRRGRRRSPSARRRTTGCWPPSTSTRPRWSPRSAPPTPPSRRGRWSDEQTVGFTFRRQAHEALIHRLDAEQTAGAVTPLDPALAADGVDEAST